MVSELVENRFGCILLVGEWVFRGGKWNREEVVGIGGAFWGIIFVMVEKIKGYFRGLVSCDEYVCLC